MTRPSSAWRTRALRTLLLLLACIAWPAHAHEVRPALLELTERAPATFDVLWKVPMLETGVLDLEPQLPGDCVPRTPFAREPQPGALLVRWTVHCPRGLHGEIHIDGLERTLTSAFVQVQFADGRRIETVATGAAARVPLERDAAPSAGAYLALGIEHILLGADHLGFVAGLVLLVHGLRRLFWTLTAFTLAHSITLAASALGGVVLPSRPVEVLIAFSIAVVAREAWCAARADAPVAVAAVAPASLAARMPWLIAFAFGLLHGFGFAGALAQVGLPEDARALALVLFNVGVEVGQLAVVCLLLPLLAWLRRAWPARQLQLAATLSTVLGSVSVYWVLQRLFG